MARNGWCTHPKRQHSTDVKILVRAGELACRNSWGGDMFQSRNAAEPPSEADAAADLPGSYQEPDASRDDEVTSVITPPDRPGDRARIVEEDRVVSDRPAPLRDDNDDTQNDAAHQDQEERARILARGSRDALIRARERHSHRRNRSSNDAGPDDDTEDPGTWSASADRVATRQIRFSDRFRSDRKHRQAPTHDDPVPRSEIKRHWQSSDDRFDSVPEVDPAFDLPGWRDQTEQTSKPARPEETAHAEEHSIPLDVEPAPVSTYEHVLQRARRVREGKSHKAARPLRHTRPQLRQAQHHAPLLDAPDQIDPYDLGDEAEPADQAALLRYQLDPLPDVEATVLDSQEEHHLPARDISSADEAPDVASDVLDYLDGDEPFDDEFVDQHESQAYEDEELDAYPADRDTERQRHRRGGWLSYLGLGRRRTSETYDDALITRHTDAVADSEAWDDDWAVSDVQETPAQTWSSRHADDNRFENGGVDAYDRWSDTLDDGGEDTYEQYAEENHPYDPGDAVAYDNITDSQESLSVLGDDRERSSSRGFDRDAATHERVEPWHRQRLVHELPDLDDNLFEETFNRRVLSPTATLDRAPVSEEPSLRKELERSRTTKAPSESYFRAARFQEWRESQTSEQSLGTYVREDPVVSHDRDVLPDLEEGHLDLRELVARGSELLDMTIEIAPDIPRECRTCRSFRSADGGARGWCTNEWAFTHRRMVNEDDLACETTIGCWWLPADRYWLIEEQDGYAATTPRMDELIARHGGSQERRASGAGA